jgi:two-component system sensor histidine kinase HydH
LHLGYVTFVPIAILLKMLSISFGTGYLSQRLRQYEIELQSHEQKRWADLGHFSAVVAHEVKNPLTGIKGAAALIERESSTPQAQRMARAIQDEVTRLDHLVVQYLSFARPRPLQTAPVSVNDVIQKALAMQSMASAAGAVRIHHELQAGLPLVMGDAEQLYEALLNLVQNSAQAAANGEVWIRSRTSGSWIEVEVADSGPGIAAELLPKIFEPFVTTKPKGSGLGLAVVRRIVEAHGGSIAAANRAEGGASFTIRLKGMAK